MATHKKEHLDEVLNAFNWVVQRHRTIVNTKEDISNG